MNEKAITMDQLETTPVERPDEKNSALRDAIKSFMKHCSIEATPHDAGKIDEFPLYLEPGAIIYVAHPPKIDLEQVVAMSVRLKEAGFVPCPHIVARKLKSIDELKDTLAKLSDAGVDRLLVLAGDSSEPEGPFSESMDVLRTGLIERSGFKRLGIAGHPEGNRAIGPTALKRALDEKSRFAKKSKLKVHIVTQFSFDPDLVITWENKTREDGIRLPIHVGMAGTVPVRQLMRYAMRCGVGASLKMLVGRTSAMASLATIPQTDVLVAAFARHRLNNPRTRFAGGHLFAFGGIESTARWRQAVINDDFTLRADGTGFDVW